MPELIPHTLVITLCQAAKIKRRINTPVRIRPITSNQDLKNYHRKEERISRMKSTMHHGESVIEDLNGVLRGMI
jgi:hypothetical protein